jgi:hypothetical protein
MQRVWRDRLRSGWLVFVCVTAVTACGGGDGGNNNPAAPTPVTPAPPAPPVIPVLSGFAIGGNTSSFGQSTEGRVTLSAVAPAGGFPVSITSSNHQAISIVSSVTVGVNTNTVAVPILTHKVSAPTTVTVSASAGDVTIPATLTLEPGTFLSFSGTDAAFQTGQSRRISGGDMVFSSSVSAALDNITINVRPRTGSGSVQVTFQAAVGEELRVGSYSGTTSLTPGQQPTFYFNGPGSVCSGAVVFVIAALKYGEGPRLERLEASFAQQCPIGAVLGDIVIEP